MKFWDIISTSNANLLRNKGRTFLTMLAIFIGAFTIIMTTGISTGFDSYIDRQVSSVGANDYLEVLPASMAQQINAVSSGSNGVNEYKPASDDDTHSTQVLTESDLKKIRKINGVKSAKFYRQFQVEYITLGGKHKKYETNVATKPTDTMKIDLAAGRDTKIDGDKAEIVLSDKFVKPLGFKNNQDAIGKTVKLGVVSQATSKISETEVKVVGVQNASLVGIGSALINEKAGDGIDAIANKGMPKEYTGRHYAILVNLASDYANKSGVNKVKKEVTKLGYGSMTVSDGADMIKLFFGAITSVLTIFGVIALVAASIGIINTLYMSVQERTSEIGLMKAMGLSKGKIFAMFSTEAAAMGFWSAMAAVVVAYLSKGAINNWASNSIVQGLPGFTLVALDPRTLVTIVVVIMLIAFVAGTLPARSASRKDPIDALRYE